MIKYLILFMIMSFLLVGCKDTTTDDENIYDANRTGQEVKKQVLENTDPNVVLNNLLPQDTSNIQNEISGSVNNKNLEDEEEVDDINSLSKNQFSNARKKDEENLLSSYNTKILTSDENRYNNIKIVADRLNEQTLAPGETFSFNEVCGPYGKDDGFLEATILLSDGTSDKGYGGGVCQLSSTLYNAVKTLDIDIIERHHHSSPVAYVPKNEDATVSLQSDLDFKFVNKGSNTLRFRTSYDPDNLIVKVYKE